MIITKNIRILKGYTQDEKLSMLYSYFGFDITYIIKCWLFMVFIFIIINPYGNWWILGIETE